MKRILAGLGIMTLLVSAGVVIARSQTGTAGQSQYGTSTSQNTTSTDPVNRNDSLAPSNPGNTNNSNTNTMDRTNSSTSGATPAGSTNTVQSNTSTGSSTLPKTASPYPLFALAGAAAIGLGSALRLRRHGS